MLNTQTQASSSPFRWSQSLEEVYQGRQTYEFKKGDNIPLYSHDIWIVCRGIVQLSTCQQDGNLAFLGLALPQMPFGLPFTQIAPYEATALSDVVLMSLSQIEVDQAPILARGMLLQLYPRLKQAEALCALVHLYHMSDRLQEFLLLLAREIGEQTLSGIRIEVRLSHQQLADMVGADRVTITRILGILRKQGWLSYDQTRHITLHESTVVDLQ